MMKDLERLIRIQSVKILKGFRVQLKFTDGTKKTVDLEPYLHGPIFEPMRNDLRVFASVKVDERAGTITWDNGADIDPDVLYYGLKPAWMDEEHEAAWPAAA